jgi:hypothetical protein
VWYGNVKPAKKAAQQQLSSGILLLVLYLKDKFRGGVGFFHGKRVLGFIIYPKYSPM